MNLSNYLAMGGYAAFIWPSYGVGVLLLAALFLLSARRLDAAERALLDAAERALKTDMADRNLPDGDT